MAKTWRILWFDGVCEMTKEELEKEKIQNALEVLMENRKLFFEDYKGTISPITCDFNNDKIIFKE